MRLNYYSFKKNLLVGDTPGILFIFMCVVDADLSDDGLDDIDVREQHDGKIGAKRLRKLEEKAARKAQREVIQFCCSMILCFVLSEQCTSTSGVQKVLQLDILDRKTFLNLYTSETYISLIVIAA